MLLIARAVGESLVIGNDIVITVNKVNGAYVNLGIEAPRATAVVRGELDPAKQLAAKYAARAGHKGWAGPVVVTEDDGAAD